jgi:hypothetical protein
VRLVLRCLTRKEPIEVLKSRSGRLVLERPGRRYLVGRCVVPFAESGCAIAVVLKHFRSQRTAFGDAARIAVPVVCQFRDLSVSDPDGDCGQSGARRA